MRHRHFYKQKQALAPVLIGEFAIIFIATQRREPPGRHKSAVLAPLGAAMLGYRVGDVFEAELPKGPAKFRVEAVLYQPESAGDYHL